VPPFDEHPQIVEWRHIELGNQSRLIAVLISLELKNEQNP